MITIKLNVYRNYIAAAAVIAVMLVSRVQHHPDWSEDVAFVAFVADFLTLGVLALIYGIVGRVAGQTSVAGRVNHWLHWGLALLVVLMAALAQSLFVKTGEILNLDILAFFLAHSGELTGAVSSVLDQEVLKIVAMCLAMVGLANVTFSRRLLAGAQYFVFLLPISLLSAGSLGIYDAESGGDFELNERLEAQALYRGMYRNIAEHQKEWNSSDIANLRRGIVNGIVMGSALGVSDYGSLARNEVAETVYIKPHSPRARAKLPNVLFLLLESVRHDALGIYAAVDKGQASDTPFLDKIAREGWRVEHAYTTIPHTSKALIGIYCGTFPRFETEISEARLGNLPLTCLPHLMAGVGYRSAHFQTAPGSFEQRIELLANVGFDDYFTQESVVEKSWERFGYLGMDDRAMVGPAIDWMKRQSAGGKPFFASMLTIASHHPYVSPGNIAAVNNPEEAMRGYKKAVRFTDSLIEDLFALMRKHGLLENTLVVITGDHGEAFFEHGQIAHNGTGYEEGIRVPLIFYGPAVRESKVIEGLRQHIDIMPTVLDMAGIEYSGKLPGTSLRRDPHGHTDLITSCFYNNYCLSHLADDGGKVLFFHGKREMEMYDLRSDPKEKRNLYGANAHANAMQRLSAAVKLKKSFELVYGSAEVGNGESPRARVVADGSPAGAAESRRWRDGDHTPAMGKK